MNPPRGAALCRALFDRARHSVVLQAEAAECGLACLAMVCRHYGDRTELAELRRRFPLSLKGTTLADLVRIAARLGFRSRPLSLALERLPGLALPAILHWDMRHFVVLASASRSRLVILDPAAGRRRLRAAEASAHFTGVALELVPTGSFAPQRRRRAISLRQLTGGIRGLPRALALVLALSLGLQLFVVLGPFFLQWVLDHVLLSADRELLTVLALGFALALLLRTGVAALRGWAVSHLSAALGLQWMGNVFAHLLRLPLAFFEQRHLGDVVSRAASVRAIQRTLTTSFVEALIDGGMAMVTFGMLWLYSPALAALSAAAVASYLGLRAAGFRPLRDATERQLVCAARQQSHLLESLRGMPSLRLAGVEEEREAAYANLMTDTVNQELALARLGLVFGGASTFVFGLERIAAIWLGARLVLEGGFSAGMLVASLAYKDQFAGRIAALVDKGFELRMLKLHGERLADIVLTEPDREFAGCGGTSTIEDGTLEVRGLWFRYAEGEPWVLSEVAFSAAPGEAVAIAGPSGGGKTTLVKLVAGLLRPTRGSIRIGGQDIGAEGARDWRRSVGAVLQDDRLFAGTIAANIALGDGPGERSRIEAAARLAAVHDEIAAMPMGYDSLVGDMGTTLSGGQQQRVMLARALYRRPRVLLLDEATSHLDVARERIVNAAVRRLTMTRLIVAHRPETIAAADRVLVLRGGRLQEMRPPAPARAGAIA